MPKEMYEVILSQEEIAKLKAITHKGACHTAREIMHANILLKTNDGDLINKKTNVEIAEMFNISPNTVNQVRKTFATEGIEASLHRRTRITAPTLSKITGDFEAQVIATALSPAPEGRARWTLRLLAEHCMEKQYVVSISYVTIGEMLNTNDVKPHLSKYWCIPKDNDADFVAHMEDVLGIYKRPYNPRIPVICMDEKPIQLLGEIRERVSAKPLRTDPDTGIPKPGERQKIDAEYIRCGTASIFMFVEPLGAWRHVEAREQRTKTDFAVMLKQLSDVYYPDAERIILVSDNLNTHNISSFYEAFPPEVAYQLMQKFDFHYTPKHGSWLNIAESELSSLARECIGNKRINSIIDMNESFSVWEVDRNVRQKGVNWQFSAEDARIKLKRLYPTPIFGE
jgi:hypothetical protein